MFRRVLMKLKLTYTRHKLGRGFVTRTRGTRQPVQRLGSRSCIGEDVEETRTSYLATRRA